MVIYVLTYEVEAETEEQAFDRVREEYNEPTNIERIVTEDAPEHNEEPGE